MLTSEKRLFLDIDQIARRVAGKCISSLEMRDNGRLTIRFGDGSALGVASLEGGRLAIELAVKASKCLAGGCPTSRQRDYLEFIAKYMSRFKISPAESDIQRLFLVSAPSVNHMVQTLERLGFITRRRGVPRSIRLVEAASCAVCGETHHLKGLNRGGVRRWS